MVEDLEGVDEKKDQAKDSKVLVEEYIDSLELKLKEKQEKMEEMEGQLKEARKTAADLELRISMFQQNASNSKITLQKKQKLFDEYAVFTMVLMIILTWVAIPVFCVVVFEFSVLISFIVGAASFIIMVCISQYFVSEVRKL